MTVNIMQHNKNIVTNIFSAAFLFIIIPNGVKLNVVTLSVVAPFKLTSSVAALVRKNEKFRKYKSFFASHNPAV